MSCTDERSRWLETVAGKPSEKNWWIAFVLSCAFGFMGVDRIYLGFLGLGILKFMSMGGAGAWWLCDLALLLSNKMHDADGHIVRRPF